MIGPIIHDDRSDITYRVWDAPSPGAIFLLVHGLGAHTGRWEFLADFLSLNNMASYAIELKGFGQSGTAHGYIDSFESYYKDIIRLGTIAGRRHPGRKVFLIGESMGGLIAYLLAAREPAVCDGLICLSPAFGNKLSFRWTDYASIFYSFFFDPMKTFRMPFDSGMCTRDTDYQKVMDENADESRMVTGRMLGNIAFAQMGLLFFKRKIAVPALFLLAGNDTIVDTAFSEKIFFEHMADENKSIVRYPEMYHALSIDLGREKVFADILNWTGKFV